MANKVVYIDPNQIIKTVKGVNNKLQYGIMNPPEDLSISVDLEVTTVSRYSYGSIKNDDSSRTFTMSWMSSQNGALTSSFFQGKKIGGINVLTDFYADISYQTSQTGENIEGVGISSIDIDFDAWYLPQIAIKFVDVRGTALFTPADVKPKSLASEFFKCFFTFPYPIFKIQIKGFYGDAVTYDLNLIDFKAEFNSRTGNFEFNTKFIGYTYAFLSDIQFDLLIAAPYCDYGGTDYWNSRNFRFYDDDGKNITGPPMQRILDYIKILQPVLTTISEVSKNSLDGKNRDTSIAQKSNYNNIVITWNALKQYFVDNSLSLGISQDNDILLVNGEKIHFKYSDPNFFYFTESKFRDIFKNFINSYTSSSTDIPPMFKKMSELFGYFISPINNINTLASSHHTDPSSYASNLVNNTTLSIPKTNEEYIYEIDMSNYISNYKTIIADSINTINSSNNKIYNNITQTLEDILKFKPTVQNIFLLIFAHLETLANTFYKCTKSIKDRILPSNFDIKYTDINSTKKSLFPPFPQYADRLGNDAWIGNEYSDLEEVKYVNSLLNAIKQVASQESIINQELINSNNNNSSIIDHIPISPFDIQQNPYASVNTIDQLKLVLVLRMFQAFVCEENIDYSDYRKTVSVNASALAEAYNIYNALKLNSEIMNLFANLKNNTIDLVDYFNKINIAVPSSPAGNEINIMNIKIDTCIYKYIYGNNFYYLPLFNDLSISNIENYFYPNNNSVIHPKLDGKKNYAAINISNGTIVSDDTLINVFFNPIPITSFNYSYFKIYSDTESAFLIDTQSYLKSYENGAYSEMVKNWNLKIDNLNKYLPTSDKNNIFILSKSHYYFTDNTTILSIGIIDPSKQFNVKDIIQIYSFSKTNAIKSYYLPESYIYRIQEGRGSLSILSKLLLLLHTLPINKSCSNIFTDENTIMALPKANLLYLGSVLWRFFYTNGDPLLQDIKNNSYINSKNYSLIVNSIHDQYLFTYIKETGVYDNHYGVSLDVMMPDVFIKNSNNIITCKLKNNVIKSLINYFMTWALSSNSLISTLDNSTYITANNLELSNFIKDLLSTNIFISLPNKAYTENIPNFEINRGIVDTYLTELVSQINYLSSSDKSNNNVDTSNDDADIIKKELYKTLKNLNDKWFSSHDLNYYTINNFFEKSFIFIDKFYNTIGNKLMINLDYFLDIILQASDGSGSANNLNDRSLYSVLTDILVKHNMLFLPSPNYLNITNTEVLENVFKPKTWYEKKSVQQQQSFFVCMAVGEPSSKLNLNNEYSDDGLIVSSDGTTNANTIGENLPCFAIDYGVQNQSYFKDMQINMNNAVNTDQSLAAIYKLSNQGTGAAKLAMGNNFYSVYTTNSYQVVIEMMGDAQIQQLMYFQLMNVPMFRGCYLIYKTQHKIVPGNMTTTFTGMRMTNISPYINGDLFSLNKAGIIQEIPGVPISGVGHQISTNMVNLENINLLSSNLQPKSVKGYYIATKDYKVSDSNWIDYPRTYNNNTNLEPTGTIKLRDFLIKLTLGEFVNSESMFSGSMSTPTKGIPSEIFNNMQTLAGYFVKIKQYNRNIIITSGWRDVYTNRNGNGSFHHVGCAVDFKVNNDDIESKQLEHIFDYIVENGDVISDNTKTYNINPKPIFKITELFFENQNGNNQHPIIHYAVSFSTKKQCIRKFTDEYGTNIYDKTIEICCSNKS